MERWTEANCLTPEKAKSVSLACKVVSSIIWDSNGLLLIDYLTKSQTDAGPYYPGFLKNSDKNIIGLLTT